MFIVVELRKRISVLYLITREEHSKGRYTAPFAGKLQYYRTLQWTINVLFIS